MSSHNLYKTREIEYNYIIDDTNRTIELYISGDANEDKLAEIGLYIRKKALELNYKLYIDLRKSFCKTSLAVAYFWFDRKYKVVNENFKFIPTVYLINTEQDKFFNFVQTICQNQGINIKIFKDEQDARDYLLNVVL